MCSGTNDISCIASENGNFALSRATNKFQFDQKRWKSNLHNEKLPLQITFYLFVFYTYFFCVSMCVYINKSSEIRECDYTSMTLVEPIKRCTEKNRDRELIESEFRIILE